MKQTIKAIIDTKGRVSLLEKIKIEKKSRALVTILDDEQISEKEMSIFGSMELLDEDLESGSRQISEMVNRAIKDSAKTLDK